MSLYGNLYNNWNDAVAKGDTFSHPTNGDLYVRLSVRYDDINRIRNVLRNVSNTEKNKKRIENDERITW